MYYSWSRKTWGRGGGPRTKFEWRPTAAGAKNFRDSRPKSEILKVISNFYWQKIWFYDSYKIDDEMVYKDARRVAFILLILFSSKIFKNLIFGWSGGVVGYTMATFSPSPGSAHAEKYRSQSIGAITTVPRPSYFIDLTQTALALAGMTTAKTNTNHHYSYYFYHYF